MAIKVAINGFGRIGRNVARAILERPDCGLELVSINDLADAKANALLFKRDSVHGAFSGDVSVDGNDLIVNGKRIQVTAERDPANLPHAANGIDIAFECTGFFTNRDGGQKHIDAGAKRVFSIAAQTPFAADVYNRLTEVMKPKGETIGQVIYDASKSTFRSEIDQALKAKPDALFLNSYTPDLTVLLRELFRAGYEGKKYTLAYAANAKLLESLPAEVVEGLVSMAPSPDIDSPAFKKVQSVVGADPDPYSCQVHDHVNLAALAIAKAGSDAGSAIHGAVRAVGNPAGVKVNSAVEGLKLLAAGKEVNFEGASGPCKFTPIGDIETCKFRFEVAEKGKYRLLSVS